VAILLCPKDQELHDVSSACGVGFAAWLCRAVIEFRFYFGYAFPLLN
jgi:hypothetical protein